MKKVAAIILENSAGEILLYLRDNKPTIPFPHHWDLFGGHIEDGESPEDALVREVQEELNYDLESFEFFKRYDCLQGDAWPNIKYVYCGLINKPIEELTLSEGESLKFFPAQEIPKLKFANILKQIVMEYLEWRNQI